jgi:hypothetical protein
MSSSTDTEMEFRGPAYRAHPSGSTRSDAEICEGSDVTSASPLSSFEAEREEFETVAAGLQRAPRLSRLWRYLGEKYFSGHTDELIEFNIATEVLGRSKSSFATSEDAIARVEAHRLRKWLKSYYETKGRNHQIQIALPPGTYVPVFVRHDPKDNLSPNSTATFEHALEPATQPTPESSLTSESGVAEQPISPEAVAVPRPHHLALFYIVPLVVVLAIGIGIGSWGHFGRPSRSSVPTSHVADSGTEHVRASQNAGITVSVPFRMIIGYHDSPEPDSAGNVWHPDEYANSGWSQRQPNVFIARTSDPFIFRYGRFGDFGYRIPLSPGTYEVHLYFIFTAATPQFEEDQSKSVFRVAINGQDALGDFDPLSDAMGMNTADERVLRDVSPAQDGFLHIHLSTVIGTPSLSALEILPGTPHKQLPIRIVTKAAPWTDHNGQFWHPDTYFLGGRRLEHNQAEDFGADADLYRSERYGHFSYAIPVDPRDRYTVVLHFAELFFGAGSGGTGSRVFRVMCNGNTLLEDFDIFREVGAGRPLIKTFHHLKPTAQGKLNLVFEPVKNYATVSAIEVLDESN